ncbi:DMT family transporter [Conexibacter sp. SYSU D00693]|uniref:EamA family transporter n=1 Tax=Conexibacter sp. SYSU D00693 TaxID=2812560 RepID=UPI00196B34AF|nr:EamA family transporter [Conexibacter sp. SYSU D00693]
MAVRDGPQAEAVGGAFPPPIVLVLSGIVSIQFGAALAATLFDDAGASGVSVLRLGFAAVLMLVVVRPRVRGVDPGALRLVGAFGLCLGAMNLTFYEALDRIPLGVAVTLEFVGPLGVAVLTSRRRLDLVWAAIAAVGIVLLADLGGGGTDALGVVLALVAGGFWGGYILLAQAAGRHFTGAQGVALAMVVAALVPLGPGIAQAGGDLLDAQLIVLGAGVALLSSVIPYTLETEALRRLPANVFGVLMSLEPALAALAGLIVLGQDLGVRELVAIGLVVAASAGVSLTQPPPPEPVTAQGA